MKCIALEICANGYSSLQVKHWIVKCLSKGVFLWVSQVLVITSTSYSLGEFLSMPTTLCPSTDMELIVRLQLVVFPRYGYVLLSKHQFEFIQGPLGICLIFDSKVDLGVWPLFRLYGSSVEFCLLWMRTWKFCYNFMYRFLLINRIGSNSWDLTV